MVQQFSGNHLMAACNDYVNFGDSSSVHGEYTGDALPSAITVNADSVRVVFTSTANSETDYGFVLDYQVTSFDKAGCTSNQQPITDGYAVLTDKPNNSTSNDTYRASNVCEYTLSLRFTNQLVCAFHKFDLKQGDFVDIYTQTSAAASAPKTRIAHFDVDEQPTQVYTYDLETFTYQGSPNTARIIIRFASDNKDQGTGFEFEYYAMNTSISQFDNVEVSVYPNPATNYVNVEVLSDEAQQFTATVVDMMGKTVYTDQIGHNGGNQVYQIPVNNLAKGVYFLHLDGTSGSHVQKFIVE
jgi:hypothetical protein